VRRLASVAVVRLAIVVAVWAAPRTIQADESRRAGADHKRDRRAVAMNATLHGSQ
jgi:hypothetical protein